VVAETSSLSQLLSPPTEISVDGVPTFLSAREGPTRVALIFRVGRADESVVTSGVTHLVEHLAMSVVGKTDYAANAFVEPTRTVFHARGTPAEVADFLAKVCQGLTDPPLDRIQLESRILRTEAAGSARGGMVSTLMYAREGARGLGLLDLPELFIEEPDPAVALAWARQRFTVENAALWIAGEPPAQLHLALPAGSRHERIELHAIPELRLPTVLTANRGGVAVSLVVPRLSRMAMTLRIAAARVQQRLREEEGLSYQVSLDYQVLDAELAHVVLLATSLPAHGTQAADGMLDVIRRLSIDGPTEEELDDDLSGMIRAYEDPDGVHAQLDMVAMRALVGPPDETLQTIVEEARAVTPSQAAQAMRDAMRTMILLLPEDAVWHGDALAPYPTWSSYRVSGGRSFSSVSSQRKGLRRVPASRLVVGESGVAIVAPRSPRRGVVWSAAVAVIATRDGGRVVIGEDGTQISVRPVDWKDGARAIEQMDRYTPGGVGVREAS
jgi:hypothetical protein